ncbi:ABC transporter permease [Paenibacillus sp. FSL M8-0334]|uniref:ABC transporter permease n=1 Tax=Paenibacillus TaxID=44249 RepID=UPI0030FBC8DA
MHRWLRHCLLEFRLLLGNPLFAALPIVYGVIYLITLKAGMTDEINTIYRLTILYHSIGHMLSLGVAMLVGILLIRRDVRRPAFEWYRSLPLSYELQLSAKYAVGMLYLSFFTLSTAVIFYVISVGSGIPGHIAYDRTMDFAVQYEVSYLVTLALAMLLGVSIPNRVVYLIGFCAWMFGTLFMDIFLISSSGLWFLQTFHLSQFFIEGRLLEFENWGYDLLRPEMLLSRMFVLAFTLLLLSVVILILNRLRPTMNVRRSWLVVIVCGVLAVVAFVPYGAMWQDRYAERERYTLGVDVPTTDEVIWDNRNPEAVGFFSIPSYDIELRRLSDDTLNAKVTLTVPAEAWEGSRYVPLTLNRNLEIQEVRVQGKEAFFRRTGEHISLALPAGVQGDLSIEIRYSGKFLYNPVLSPSRSMFSQGTEVNLPNYAAWYPLPGHQPIYIAYGPNDVNFGAVYTTAGLLYPDSQVELTLQGYSVPVYTGLKEMSRQQGLQTYSGNTRNGVYLLAGADWMEMKIDDLPVTLVTTPYRYNDARPYLKMFKQKYDYFSSWIPELRYDIDTIVLVDHNPVAYTNYSVVNQMILSPRDYMSYAKSHLPADWMSNWLFGDRLLYYPDWPEGDVILKIRSLFWYMYYREVEGLTDEDLKRGYFGTTVLLDELFYSDEEYHPNQVGLEILKMVSKAVDEGRGDQVKRLLVYFYEQEELLSDLNGYLNGYSGPEQPIIPYSEWLRQWELVVEDGA